MEFDLLVMRVPGTRNLEFSTRCLVEHDTHLYAPRLKKERDLQGDALLGKNVGIARFDCLD